MQRSFLRTLASLVSSCGENPHTCGTNLLPALCIAYLEYLGWNPGLLELVNEADTPPRRGGRSSTRGTAALGVLQRTDIGGSEGKLHRLGALLAKPEGL